MISAKTSLRELAGLVSSALAQNGIDAVLTGGAAVTVWTEEKAQSFDLDYITHAEGRRIQATMAALGFRKVGKDFHHASTAFFVEFPPGPLAVGQELAAELDVQKIETPTGAVRIVSPTFCVMDRLAQYFHWNDRMALEQAVMVSVKHRIQITRVQRWAEGEGMTAKFASFQTLLRARRRKNRS